MTEDTDLHAIDDDFPEEVVVEEATDQTPEQTALDRKINQYFGVVSWSARTWSRSLKALIRLGVPARPIRRLRR